MKPLHRLAPCPAPRKPARGDRHRRRAVPRRPLPNHLAGRIYQERRKTEVTPHSKQQTRPRRVGDGVGGERISRGGSRRHAGRQRRWSRRIITAQSLAPIRPAASAANGTRRHAGSCVPIWWSATSAGNRSFGHQHRRRPALRRRLNGSCRRRRGRVFRGPRSDLDLDMAAKPEPRRESQPLHPGSRHPLAGKNPGEQRPASCFPDRRQRVAETRPEPPGVRFEVPVVATRRARHQPVSRTSNSTQAQAHALRAPPARPRVFSGADPPPHVPDDRGQHGAVRLFGCRRSRLP